MPNKKISELTTASALSGTELVEVVQGGENRQTTTQDIANLGGGAGTAVETVTGEYVDNTDPENPVITGIDAAIADALRGSVGFSDINMSGL